MKFRTLQEVGHQVDVVQILNESVENDSRLHAGKSNIILVPQPTNDVNDPLRWPLWKKYFVFIQVLVFTSMVTGYVSGFSPGLLLLSVEFNAGKSEVSQLVTWPLLLAGLGNFYWVPLAEVFGKRPVFVVASLGFFLSVLGSAVATKFSTLLACRILSTAFGSATEALGALITNDIFFLHERGAKMALYIIFLYGGNALLSLIAGFVIQGAGWRWYCWLCTIISGLNFLCIALMVPETRYKRSLSTTAGFDDDKEPAKSAPTSEAVEKVEIETRVELTGTKKSFLQNLSLWSGTAQGSLLSHFMRPWLLCAYPAVSWATVAYGLALAWQIGINTLSSFVFQVPPYSFSPGINGLVNIPALLGNLAGAYIGGNLTDYLVRWNARRHDGIFSPESRLIVLVVSTLVVPAGILMFGFGAQDKLHWSVLYVGYFFLNMCNITPTAIMSYILDSYEEAAPEALVLINGLKSAIAFGFTYSFVPWTTSAGYVKVMGTMAGTWVAWHLLVIPLFIYGRPIRHYTIKRFKVIFW